MTCNNSLRSSHIAATIVAALFTLIASNGLTAEPAWPQFLGPNRDGISTETGLANTFPDSGPKVVWRVPGGIGMSGVALDGQRAVTMVEQKGKQTVIALNPADGKTLWQTPIAAAYRNAMGNGSRATPTIAGDTVFAYTGEGILVALDRKSGKIQWSQNTVAQFEGEPAQYGMACSPLVVDGLVIVTPGAGEASIAAYDAASGKVTWKAGGDPAGYSSPALLELGGRKQVVAFTGQSALGLDAKTGDVLWRYPFATNFDCNIATPVAVGDKVFISAGENHGSVLLALKPSGKTFQPVEVWKSLGASSVLRTEWQTAALIDGYLYGLDNAGAAGPITHLCCVEAATGKLKWRQLRFGKSNCIAADGKLYFTTFKGELVIVKANPEKFEELARAPLLNSTRQAPSLLDGKLYVRDNEEIVCVDIAK